MAHVNGKQEEVSISPTFCDNVCILCNVSLAPFFLPAQRHLKLNPATPLIPPSQLPGTMLPLLPPLTAPQHENHPQTLTPPKTTRPQPLNKPLAPLTCAHKQLVLVVLLALLVAGLRHVQQAGSRHTVGSKATLRHGLACFWGVGVAVAEGQHAAGTTVSAVRTWKQHDWSDSSDVFRQQQQQLGLQLHWVTPRHPWGRVATMPGSTPSHPWMCF